LSLALPDSYKYVEQKTETTFRVEDALRELEDIEGESEEVTDIHLPREISAPGEDNKEPNHWPNGGK
jgi:hypothetical protein